MNEFFNLYVGIWLALRNLAMILLLWRMGKLGLKEPIRMAMLGVKEISSITECLNVEFETGVFV